MLKATDVGRISVPIDSSVLLPLPEGRAARPSRRAAARSLTPFNTGRLEFLVHEHLAQVGGPRPCTSGSRMAAVHSGVHCEIASTGSMRDAARAGQSDAPDAGRGREQQRDVVFAEQARPRAAAGPSRP